MSFSRSIRFMGLVFSLAAHAVFSGSAYAQSSGQLGPLSFQVEAQRGDVSADGTLFATLLVTNTSKTTARAFVRGNPDPAASDNRGNGWSTNIFYDVTGIYVCKGQSACLERDRKQTEQNATIIEPGQQLQIQIKYYRSGTVLKTDKYGDTFNAPLLAYVQPVSEERTASGSAFVGGAWRTVPFGKNGIPLRSAN